ncbi:MAG: hypothetical protein WCJ56_13850 [bacterium]
MLLLCDSDILLKLAACDLLEEAISMLGATREDIRILPSFSFMLKKPKSRGRFCTRYGETAVLRLEKFNDGLAILESERVSIEILAALQGITDIDEGEIQFFAAGAVATDAYYFLTGDKRAIRSLATSTECQPIAEQIAGHIICLEMIIASLICSHGFDYVKAHVVPARTCDTALMSAFGSGDLAESKNVIAGLIAYIDELRALPINLLAPIP